MLIRLYRHRWREKTKISLIQNFWFPKVFNDRCSFNTISCNMVHLRLEYTSVLVSYYKMIWRNIWMPWMKQIHHGGPHRAPTTSYWLLAGEVADPFPFLSCFIRRCRSYCDMLQRSGATQLSQWPYYPFNFRSPAKHDLTQWNALHALELRLGSYPSGTKLGTSRYRKSCVCYIHAFHSFCELILSYELKN